MPPLAIPKSNELCWHIVCGSVEIEELERAGAIRQWQPRQDRHSLFLTMKYPTDIFYKGSWGSELLHFDREADIYMGKTGKIYCTYQRYREISEWFLSSMYNQN